MACPQPDKFVRVSTELLEAIARFDFTGAELRILLYVIRRTYGFNRKVDQISIGKFVREVGLPKQTVIDCLNRLVRMTVLVRTTGLPITEYGVQKDYDRWVVRTTGLVRTVGLASTNHRTRVVRNDTPSTPSPINSIIDNTKDNIIKATSDDVTVNDAIKYFEPINPHYTRFYPNTSQRAAVERLLKLHGAKVLAGAIKAAKIALGKQYYPQITTPIQLEEKWAQLEAKFKKKTIRKVGYDNGQD